MPCPRIPVITRPSWGSTLGKYGRIEKRPWWAKGAFSWVARWNKATHLSVVLVILWLLLINTTNVAHRRNHLRKTLWLWWQRHKHLYNWWISMNSGSWYHCWIRAFFLSCDHVSQQSLFPLSMSLLSLVWWRILTNSHMSSWVLICGCLLKMSRFFHYLSILLQN